MSTLALKIIKSKDFEAQGNKATHYTLAYKGRVFGFNTLKFESKDFEIKDNTLIIKTDIEVLKETSFNPLDNTSVTYLQLVPKMDIALGAF